MESKNTIQKRIINIANIAIVIFTIVVGCIIVFSSISFYRDACAFEKETRLINLKADSVRYEFYKNCDTIIAHNDSLTAVYKQPELSDTVSDQFDAVFAKIAQIEKSQDTVLSDIRQESNNIINKFNGWIAFWIALLAIFGGALPIIIQYIQSRKTRIEVNEMLDNINIKSANSHIELLASTLWVDYSCSVLSDCEIRPKVRALAIAEASNALQELIIRIESHDHVITKSNRTHLINALVQCFSMIDIIKLGQRNRDVRELNNVQDSIRRIIKDTFDLENHPESELIRRIHDLVPRIAAIH